MEQRKPDEAGNPRQCTPGKIAEEELVCDDDGTDRDQQESDRVGNGEHTDDTHPLACQTTQEISRPEKGSSEQCEGDGHGRRTQRPVGRRPYLVNATAQAYQTIGAPPLQRQI